MQSRMQSQWPMTAFEPFFDYYLTLSVRFESQCFEIESKRTNFMSYFKTLAFGVWKKIVPQFDY